MRCILLLLLVIALPILAYAIDAPSEGLVHDNAALFSYVLGVCFVIIAFFIHRMLGQIDKQNKADSANNINQWKAITTMNARLAHLEGVCEAQSGGRCYVDPPIDLRKEVPNAE